jgi:hypothetical protein
MSSNMSTSHPLISFNNNNNNNGARSLFTVSGRSNCDKSTQTPENIERETRRHRLRSLRVNISQLGFLNNRERTNLSANAVVTEQKATAASIFLFYNIILPYF